MAWFATHVLNALAFASLLFIVASGLTVTFGLMRIVNLAHGAFYLLGGYLTYQFAQSIGNYWLTVLVALVVVAIIGMIAERTLIHPVLGDELAQTLMTFGIALLIGDQILSTWTSNPLSPPNPPGLVGAAHLGPITFPVLRLGLIVAGVVLAAIMLSVLRRSRVGAMLRAAVDDQDMARSIGIPVPAMFLAVFGIGTALAAFAGALGGAFSSLTPAYQWNILLFGFVVVIVGGMGSVSGSLVAAVIVGLIDEFGKVFFPEFALFTVFAPVAVFLAIRPRGLLGKVELGV